MFRIWGKKFKKGRMIEHITLENDNIDLELNDLVKEGVYSLCEQMDLCQPIWFSKHYKDLTYHRQTRFYSDAFIEEIDFDYFEITIVEYTKI